MELPPNEDYERQEIYHTMPYLDKEERTRVLRIVEDMLRAKNLDKNELFQYYDGIDVDDDDDDDESDCSELGEDEEAVFNCETCGRKMHLNGGDAFEYNMDLTKEEYDIVCKKREA